jgi:hypothetical protein
VPVEAEVAAEVVIEAGRIEAVAEVAVAVVCCAPQSPLAV